MDVAPSPMLTTLTIALPLLATSWFATAASTTVELRERVTVEGDVMTLAQLAEIAPGEDAETLGALEIGPAPLPGGSRRVTLGYVKMRVRHSGARCGEIQFSGPGVVEVRRAAVFPQSEGAPEPADTSGGSETLAAPAAEPPPLVERGARVRLTVVCGAVSISAEATLLESAAVGERARMRVEQTRETVVAQIVQPSEAIISRE